MGIIMGWNLWQPQNWGELKMVAVYDTAVNPPMMTTTLFSIYWVSWQSESKRLLLSETGAIDRNPGTFTEIKRNIHWERRRREANTIATTPLRFLPHPNLRENGPRICKQNVDGQKPKTITPEEATNRGTIISGHTHWTHALFMGVCCGQRRDCAIVGGKGIFSGRLWRWLQQMVCHRNSNPLPTSPLATPTTTTHDWQKQRAPRQHQQWKKLPTRWC